MSEVDPDLAVGEAVDVIDAPAVVVAVDVD